MTVHSLRNFNSHDLTGSFSRSAGMALDDLVIDHLVTQQELQRLDGYEEVIARMTVEGFSAQEIATECGASVRTVFRILRDIKISLAM